MDERAARPEGVRSVDGRQFAEAPKPEQWVGRLRYIVVPIVAVVAIAAIIYVLQGPSNSGSTEAGAVSAINVGPLSAEALRVPAPRVGQPAAEFTLNGLDGKPISLADFRGKTVFLNFFASWCPPCRAEMPDIRATYEENKDAGVVVLAVNLQEDRQIVINYASTAGLTFPIVLDPRGEVTSIYRITGLPTSYFIDKNGVIRDMQIGGMSKATMLNKLRKAQQAG